MAGSDTSTQDDDAADAKAAYDLASEAWADNYRDGLEAMRFARLHEHWPPTIQRERELDGRPCLTIPLLPAFINQVVNDARQNKPAITVHPVDSEADPQTAEIFNGLIRHIEQSSDADVAYDTALEHAVTAGFGWWTINTRYTTDDTFEQDICIEAKPNAFSVVPDPQSTAADTSDWNDAFELDSIPKAAFEERWDGADPVSFTEATGVSRTPQGDEENIIYGVRWQRERSFRTIVALSAPQIEAPDDLVAHAIQTGLLPPKLVIDLADYKANKELFDALGVSIIGQPRKVPSFKVTQKIYSGCEELETNPWAGKFIPIVGVYGVDINIEGKRHLYGMVKPAMDEQRRFNYEMTAATEASGLAPKVPFIGQKGQFVTDADKWASANTGNHAYIEYDPVAGAPPPQRQTYAGPPTAQLQMALTASDGVKRILGMFDASLGQKSNETSGRAIMARQREGDVGSFHYIDNLSRSIRHAGRIVLDLIPKVYSTPRIVRILGLDGEAQSVRVAPPGAEPPPLPTGQQAQQGTKTGLPKQAADIEKVYDLTVGKYDLVVTSGPSFTSRREEAANQMIELIRAYPAVAPIIGDLLAKNLDWPGADEIAERMKAMLPAQLQGQSPESQAMKAQMDEMVKVLGQAKAKITELETDKEIEARRVRIEEYGAETGRIRAIAPKGVPVMDEQGVALLVMQTLRQAIQNPDTIFGAGEPDTDNQLPPAGQPMAAPAMVGQPGA